MEKPPLGFGKSDRQGEDDNYIARFFLQLSSETDLMLL